MYVEPSAQDGEAEAGHDPSPCASCAVRADAFCGSLAAPALGELHRLGRKVRLKRGQALIWQGAESTLVGNVLEGVLKMSAMSRDGREQIVGLAYPADFIGRPFGKNSRQTITALSDAHLCVFSRAAFDSFATGHAEMGEALLRRALDDLDGARRWMLLLGRTSAMERVATLLLDAAERLDGMAGATFALPFSRQQMADILGMAIETVSRTMTRLRDGGVIALPGGRQIAVRDMDALRQAAGG